jgi:AraC family transcriptional regulator of adaptative response/methylated-DNA-[protein]-cysteine methyltransferase
MGRFDFAAIATKIRKTHVIDHDEHNVGALRFVSYGWPTVETKEQKTKGDDKRFHPEISVGLRCSDSLAELMAIAILRQFVRIDSARPDNSRRTFRMLTAVKSTRIFCNDRCPAQPPRKENRVMLPTVRDCLGLGCRPCKRCKPMHVDGGPEWLQPLFNMIEDLTKLNQLVDERSLRTLGLTKQSLGRWFATHQQFTFDAYCRMRRLGFELGTHFCHAESKDSVGRKRLFEPLLQRKAIRLYERERSGPMLVNRVITRLGPMVVCANDDGICLLEFADRRMLETQLVRIAKLFDAHFRIGINEHVRQLDVEMREYFAGRRRNFEVALVDGATEFQNSVWEQLKTIPLGETSTYQKLAIRLGKPNAVRAVGRANGDNRFTILIPCHRVLGSDGSLTGYGGGLDRKQWLLDHERKIVGA